MKLTNYSNSEGKLVACVVGDDGLLYKIRDNKCSAPTVDDLLARYSLHELDQVTEEIAGDKEREGIRADSVKLSTPVISPEKILLAAVNYHSHLEEHHAKPPSEPYFFTKFRNALIASGEEIIIPKISKMVDWEVELAVIIGKKGKYIPRNKAFDYVAGYSVAVDVSFRDLRFPSHLSSSSSRSSESDASLGTHWVKAKGLDNSFPLGPWLVTVDEVPDPQTLEISLSVNGVIKQRSNTAEMIFSVDELIEHASTGITLKPGDIISTGTPGGVAMFTDQKYLKDGDIVEATISRIGTIRNPVRAE